MALAESGMMELGTIAPSFNLFDTISERNLSLIDLKSEKATVVIFICNHCPYVIHINKQLVKVANIYQKEGVQFIAINSNDVISYPEDSPEQMKVVANKLEYPFPYLYDESQEVAKEYGAVCTPDLFVFDGNLLCIYRGQFDSSRPNGGKATGQDLINVLEAILNKTSISKKQYPSVGCSIKWK